MHDRPNADVNDNVAVLEVANPQAHGCAPLIAHYDQASAYLAYNSAS